MWGSFLKSTLHCGGKQMAVRRGVGYRPRWATCLQLASRAGWLFLIASAQEPSPGVLQFLELFLRNASMPLLLIAQKTLFLGKLWACGHGGLSVAMWFWGIRH